MDVGGRSGPFPWTVSAQAPSKRGWQIRVMMAFGGLVAVGWPLLFWTVQSQRAYHNWLGTIAVGWWVIVGAVSLLVVLARIVSRGG
jgi:hypothetical protein